MTLRHMFHVLFAVGAMIATIYGLYFIAQLVLHNGPHDMLLPSLGETFICGICAVVFWRRRHS